MIRRTYIRYFYISFKLYFFLLKIKSLIANKNPEDSYEIPNKIISRNRSNTIISEMEGLTLFVYNGKEYKDYEVVNEMIGDKFGDFSFTRHISREKKKKKKRKNFKKK